MYSQARVEDYLDKAISVLEENLADEIYSDMVIKDGQGQIFLKPLYKSYVNALGPTLLKMGVLPTIAVYSAEGASEGSRKLIVDLLAQVCDFSSADELFDTYRRMESPDKEKLEIEIESAVVALKLALRTYKFAPEGKTSDG